MRFRKPRNYDQTWFCSTLGFRRLMASKRLDESTALPRGENTLFNPGIRCRFGTRSAQKLGALGYVVKARAASELLAAVETVRRGMQFVSEGLFGHSFTDAADTQVPDRLSHEKALPPLRPRKAEIIKSPATHFRSILMMHCS